MYLVSLALRANNYFIQIIAQNNFAQVETCIEGRYARSHARTLARRSQSYYIQKNLVLDSFVPSAL